MNFNFWGFIVMLICLVGVPQVTMAQSEEDILNSIGSELDDESAKQKEAERIEKEYKAIKVKADAAFKTKKFEKAREYYGQMLKLKPDSEFASSRLALIDQEIAKASEAEARKKYEGLIAKADALMASEKWDEAIAGYKAATAANPDEQYPKSQISKVEKLKAEAKAAAQAAAIQKQYDETIATAEKALASKSWDVAKQQFLKASKLKPDESYPREQVVKVDKLKAEAEAQAEQIKMDKRYQTMIDAGDQALAAKDWETAKAKYKLAMETKPAEAYAKEQYNSVDKFKADYLAERERARVDKEYKDLIAKADQFFNSKDWESAIPVYEQAASLKSSESYPKTRITEAKGNIAEELEAKKKAEQQESEFQKHKKIGEEALANEKWDMAIESFVTASSIKPDHTDVKRLLTQAKSGKKAAEELALKQKAEEEARLKTQKQYESAMVLGNKALTEKNWDNARQAFNEAKKLKPEESDPEAKLQELDKLIAEEKRLAEEAAEKARLEEEARLKAEQERIAAEKAVAEAAEQERLAAEAAEKARLEAEAKLKAEQERLAAEKAAAEAAEQERLAAEAAEKARLEEEAKLKAEQERLAAEKAAAEAAEQERLAVEAAKKARLEEEAKLKAEQEVAEQERLAQEEKQKQEDFKKAVKEYEQAIKDSDWDLALRAINSAQAFFPDNPKVEEMQSELAKLQAKEQQALAVEKEKEAKEQVLNKQYEDLIAQADKSFGRKEYKSAKADYEQALKLKPDETYPSNRLSEIQELILAQNAAELEKQKEMDRQYSQLMSEGESFIFEKNWDAAKSSINAALELKPDHKGPVERIAEIEALIQKEKDLAKQAEALEADYRERMKNGDEALQNNKFADAKRFYFGASKLKPEEVLPKQKLEETETLWAQFLEEEKKAAAAQKAQQLEDNYNGFIMSGDQALNSELWDEAIKSYEGAMALKPEEAYPKEKLSVARQGKAVALAAAEKARAEEAARLEALEKERLKKEAEAQRLAQLEDDFKSYVANGDQAMEDKNLKLAVSSYKRALELKPEDSSVQPKYDNAIEQYKVVEAERIAAQKERQRLAAIELEKRQEEARKKREAYLAELRKNSPEELAKNYPDGITEEVDTENDVVLTKSIIVENGEGRYLIRFDYPWGEHFYYLNGKKIREDAYNWNIRKYKF